MPSIQELREQLAAAEAERDNQIANQRIALYAAACKYVDTYREVEGKPVAGLIIDERELEAAARKFSDLVDEVEADK